MEPQTAAALLERTTLFGGLGDRALASIAVEANERTFKKGEVIFHENQPGDAFYVVAEGSLKVFVTSTRGEEMVLVTLREPDVLGEVALLDGGPRSASAQALESTRLLAFARSKMLGLMHRDPAIAEGLLRSVGGTLRRLTVQAADLVFLDLEGRVAKVLVQLSERAEPTAVAVELDLGLTQTDLAKMVGGSRQSVNQILHGLQDRGFLSVDGRMILIRDMDALRRRASLSA